MMTKSEPNSNEKCYFMEVGEKGRIDKIKTKLFKFLFQKHCNGQEDLKLLYYFKIKHF